MYDCQIMLCLAQILARYDDYTEIKKTYAEDKNAKQGVLDAYNGMCRKIYDLVKTLYSMTDMPLERVAIQNMIEALKAEVCY